MPATLPAFSEPAQALTRPSTPVRASARRPTVGKLYAKEPRSWGGKIVLAVLVLALLGGGAYWYVVLRPTPGWQYPWTPVLKFLHRAPAPAAPAPTPTSTPTAAAPPAAPGAAAQADSLMRSFDQASDALSAAITQFGDRALRFGGKSSDCAPLDSALTVMEDAWTVYNQHQQNVTLDAARAARDQQLASGADGGEATFERSGCQRP